MPRQPPDPLVTMFARRRISRPQYLAGLEFRKHHEQGPAAGDALGCHTQLGTDGFVLLCSVLIDGKSAREIAASRGLTGQSWDKFLYEIAGMFEHVG
jgi:hypothetical protein